MKRHIFTFLIFLLPLFSFADREAESDSSRSQSDVAVFEDLNASEAERIVDKYSGKISDAFSQGVEAVAPTVKEGFVIVVKLQKELYICFQLYFS